MRLHPWLVDADPAGPTVHRLVHTGIAAAGVLAWASLGAQIQALAGWQGVEPVDELLLRLRAANPELSWWDFPSHTLVSASDASLVGGCALGGALCALAAAGIAPRVLLPLSGVLYLGYCYAARVFLSFQWDNLLVEASLLAALVPRDRPSRVARFVVLGLLFKVFFLSGLAKWGSSTGDWRAGTAMAAYYETAPLPTPLARALHRLPAGWHAAESAWTLVFELVLPFGLLLGRGPRAAAGLAFGAFLLLDALSANYGFFVPLTAALCLGLLPEGPTARALGGRSTPARGSAAGRASGAALALSWAALSALVAAARFTDHAPAPQLTEVATRLRVANAYHLFGSVTTERHEAEIQTSPDGDAWAAQSLRHKPGPEARRPDWGWFHLPRVDFRMWFYGLHWREATPPFVAGLLRRVCWDPEAVQGLFAAPLPTDTRYVRIVVYDTRYAPPESPSWWTRRALGGGDPVPCDRLGW